MSWSEAARSPARHRRRSAQWGGLVRGLAVAGLLASATALAACSFSPVYSGTLASQPMLNLAYAKPTTRLEQVVYQELALRFGTSEAATAPLATVSVGSASPVVAMSTTANPNKLYRAVVTATLTITRRDGTAAEPISFTRQASAEYTTSGQVLADTAAANEAAERAAKAAAESLRLAVMASLSR
jgi:hypothetical protein